jgi:hypothetical protein
MYTNGRKEVLTVNELYSINDKYKVDWRLERTQYSWIKVIIEEDLKDDWCRYFYELQQFYDEESKD